MAWDLSGFRAMPLVKVRKRGRGEEERKKKERERNGRDGLVNMRKEYEEGHGRGKERRGNDEKGSTLLLGSASLKF